MKCLVLILTSLVLPLAAIAGGSSGGSGGGVGPRPDALISVTTDVVPAVKYGRILQSGSLEYEIGQIRSGRVEPLALVIVDESHFTTSDGSLIKALLASKRSKTWVDLTRRPNE